MTQTMKDGVSNAESPTLIYVFVAMRDGGPVHEELPARALGDARYELLASPGLALNLARGDTIEIADPNAPVTVVRRGGNFCIHIYSDHIAPEDIRELEGQIVRRLSGTLDGIYRGNLAVTIPAASGMANIAEVFDAFTQKTGIQWYYANIYKNPEDLSDETLLDWWL